MLLSQILTTFSDCKKSLADLRDVYIFPCALSDVEGFSTFCSDGSRSSLYGSNDFRVQTQKLDAFDLGIPGLIKFDIEGAELQALEGARATIQQFRPCLAVAAYHSPLSLVEMPELVFSICPCYQVYIRHYGESIYETIMYFVPNTSVP